MRSKVVALGDLVSPIMGQAPPGSDCNKSGKGTIFVKAGEFDERFPLVREWTTNPLKLARKGDVLVCVVGATAGKVNDSIDCAIGRSVAAIRPDTTRLVHGYLYWFMQHKALELRRSSQGLAQGVITREMIASLEIPLPPLDEQKRIAAILDQADALRRLRTRALDRLNALGQAIFHEMFGQGSDATLCRLGDLTTKIGSGATPRGGDAAYQLSGIPLIRSMNVRDGAFELKGLAYLDDAQADGLKNVIVQSKDVLLNITGASVARVCLAPDNLDGARVNQHVAIIRPKAAILPEFLAQFLLLPKSKGDLLRIAEAGATRQAITKAQIEDFEVLVPRLDMQKQFVARLSAATRTLDESQKQLAGFDALFTSLQHRAFRGEL